MAFLNLTNVGLRNGAGIYYFKYVVGNEGAISTFNFVGFLCFVLGALATKLFNASRFVLLNVQPGVEAAPRPATPADRWILSRLQRVIADTTGRIDEFEFAKASLGLYDFVYGEL